MADENLFYLYTYQDSTKGWPADQYEYVSGQLTEVWLALIGQLYFFINITYMYFKALQT